VTAAPVPEIVMASGEFDALLATVTLPVMLPAPDGLNVTARLAVCPGFKMRPVETPLALKPAPDRVTPETVTVEFPALFNVTFWVAVLETFTLPKLSDETLEFRMSVLALTVSVAALLVAEPALLATTAVNFALLSEAVSAGVV
jgi:hypothetical protein